MKNDEILNKFRRTQESLKIWLDKDPRRKAFLLVGGVVFFIYVLSFGEEKVSYIYKSNKAREFSQENILENPYKTIYDGKLDVLESTRKEISSENKRLREELEGLKIDLGELLKKKKEEDEAREKETQTAKDKASEPNSIDIGDSPLTGDEGKETTQEKVKNSSQKRRKKARPRLKKSTLVFPVKMKTKPVESGVVIGVGSWVLGTIIAGAEIPQSATYPVLIQLDQAYSMANQRSISLVGCLMIGKATPIMSTRRVEIQPESMACFSKSGKYFEKKGLNGWVADSKDNNIGIAGKFKSNVNRLAEYTFVKSLLQGVEEIVSRKSKVAGGQNPDRPDVIVQQGASESSNLVVNFLMKQAKQLLPTLEIYSGRKVYVVTKDSVRLPYEFFNQSGGRNEEFTHSFSVLD